jgi:hypothetical protein
VNLVQRALDSVLMFFAQPVECLDRVLDVLQPYFRIAALMGVKLDHSEYVRPIYAIARHARAQRLHVLLDRFGFVHAVVTSFHTSQSPSARRMAAM